MEKLVYDFTYTQEETCWWHRGRRKIIFDLIKKFSNKDTAKKILDIGCGTGLLLKELETLGTTWGVDCSELALDYCQRRGLESIKKGDIAALPFGNEEFDIVLALDVLEHIEDDEKALKEMRRVLRSGGLAIIFVPAFRFLWSRQDEISHHFRRYGRKPLARKIKKVGFRLLRVSYFNTFLFLPTLLLRFFINLFGTEKTEAKITEAKLLNPILSKIFSAERALLKCIDFPFGVSILFVLKKN
jgi:ubiquinone/menaquinone biosynthesis C-methylase UbiE